MECNNKSLIYNLLLLYIISINLKSYTDEKYSWAIIQHTL